MHPLMTVALVVAAHLVGVYLTREAVRERLEAVRAADKATHDEAVAELARTVNRLSDALARLLAAVRDGRDIDAAAAGAAAALDGHGYTGDLAAARAALEEAEAELAALRQHT